ncbi:MAG TPA: FtsX-like permease family protein [Polyangiales bacterium]
MSLARFLAPKNLRTDRFATFCMVLGIALGTATVNVVLTLDENTRLAEAASWVTNPDLAPDVAGTVSLAPARTRTSPPNAGEDIHEETHEDYQVMRSVIRLGSLSAFLVGALIVFFSLAVVVEHRFREVALLRSLGATPRQVASIFVREAAWVGAIGAVMGFLMAVPMSYVAAWLGITTTGRSRLDGLVMPWFQMFWVSLLGGATALLGVAPPVRRILKMNASQALRPRMLEAARGRAFEQRTSGIILVAVPFAALVYGLLRPLLHEVLPSLFFVALEAVLAVMALLALLLFVPGLTRGFGALLVRAFLYGPAAARLLLARRVRRQGDDLAWSVGGIMLVFALLLALHLSTHALKNEVTRFGDEALVDHAFVFTDGRALPGEVLAAIPPEIVVTRYSSRTPEPNPISAVSRSDLLEFARASQRPDLLAIAQRFREDSVILSRLMARRLGVAAGDRVELSSPGGVRLLQVAGVTDGLGFVPMLTTYRSSKTYAVVEAGSFPLLEPFSQPIGSALVLSRKPGAADVNWNQLAHDLPKSDGVYAYSGVSYLVHRWFETNRDFFIFDMILFLTTLLAAVGVANQLVLAVHARRGEIALLRVLGMTAAQVQKMLWLEGAFVGLLGGTLAVVLGVPLGYTSLAALNAVSAFEVEFHLPVRYVILTIGAAVAVALLAALYPARRAARARSAESIHYE